MPITLQSNNEITISNPSQDKYWEIFRTVPIKPRMADLNFLAEGIPTYSKLEAQIMRWCGEHKVFPLSTAHFRYSEEKKIFVPTVGTELSGVDSKTVMPGGRFHCLNYETRTPLQFERFVQTEVDALKQHGYRPSTSNLAITTYRLTGYNQGTYPDTEIFMTNDKIDLRLKSRLTEEQKTRLREWFTNLSSR